MQFDNELLQRLRQAENIVFFTGSGVSVESGIPTFRDSKNALWGDFDALTFATEFGFCADPAKVWQWYAERRKRMQTLLPNPGHRVIAAWQDKVSDTKVITQNIDGLHQRAGSREVLELHGNIMRNKCFAMGHPYLQLVVDDLQPPRCRECDSLIRPDIVWFNEELPLATYTLAEHISFNCDVFVSIGTSLEVYPAKTLPINSQRCEAYLIQINPQSTDLDKAANCNLRGKSGEVLPLLWEAVWGESLP